MLEAALDRLAVDLRGLADTMPCIDALEAYLDLARPLVNECEGRDRFWVNARVEEIWSACPAVACRRPTGGGSETRAIPRAGPSPDRGPREPITPR